MTWRRVQIGWMVAFTALTFYALNQNRGLAEANKELIVENKHRIDDIQQARASSCRQTYEGIREVFTPFFVPAAQRTAAQKADYKKFNDTIDRRKQRCATQTSTGGTE